MFEKICSNCHQIYRIEDVKVDTHWNSFSLEPAYCYCPHCNAILSGVYPRNVDFVKHLKLKYILVFVGVFSCAILGIAAHALEYVDPIMLALFGAWLAKTAQLKDHRIIGWLLITLSVIVFTVFVYTA